MDVDESGGDDKTLGVDLMAAPTKAKVSDRRDAIADDGNVGRYGGRSRAVDDASATEHYVAYGRYLRRRSTSV
jgi:hypothetical protein